MTLDELRRLLGRLPDYYRDKEAYVARYGGAAGRDLDMIDLVNQIPALIEIAEAFIFLVRPACDYDTDGYGVCHRCVRRGGCQAIGGPFVHNPKNPACPLNDPETSMSPVTAGLSCTCVTPTATPEPADSTPAASGPESQREPG